MFLEVSVGSTDLVNSCLPPSDYPLDHTFIQFVDDFKVCALNYLEINLFSEFNIHFGVDMI